MASMELLNIAGAVIAGADVPARTFTVDIGCFWDEQLRDSLWRVKSASPAFRPAAITSLSELVGVVIKEDELEQRALEQSA